MTCLGEDTAEGTGLLSRICGNLSPQFKKFNPIEISRAYPCVLIPSYLMLLIKKPNILVYVTYTDTKLSQVTNPFVAVRIKIILTR